MIRARDLTKVYRLYHRKHHRLLDLFGLLPAGGDRYQEHAALQGVNLDIHAGEKVAIIGRNGAGKSTFLRLVTGVIEPSRGSVQVERKIHSLLSIGTGFHPDFTGRENVFAYLASLGITGAEAREKFAEIAEFAEIEDYIEQPFKTYSTGMGVRLMFATSTSIRPELLVLDEVLGVGDAYFVHKSFDRIKRMCEGDGTTLLLVTHDIYTAVDYCDRMIWFDRGQVILDGSGEEVVRAYEASIRLQEEARLRQRSLHAFRDSSPKHQTGEQRTGKRPTRAQSDGATVPIFVQLVPANRSAFVDQIRVHGLRISRAGEDWETFDLQRGVGERDARNQLVLDSDQGNWGPALEQEGAWVREIQPHGSIFHRAPLRVGVPADELESGSLQLHIDWLDASPQNCFVEAYAEDGRALCEKLPAQSDGQRRESAVALQFPARDAASHSPMRGLGQSGDESDAAAEERFGNRRLEITKISLRDDAGTEKHQYQPGHNLHIGVQIEGRDTDPPESISVNIAIHRERTKAVTRMISQELPWSSEVPSQELVAKLEPLLLGPGEYTLTVGIYAGAYWTDNDGRHVATSPHVFDLIKHAVHFEVKQSSLEDYLVEYSQPCSWGWTSP